MKESGRTSLETVTILNDAVTARDWDTFASLLAEDLSYTVMSAQLPGGNVPMDRETLLSTLPAMTEMFATGSPVMTFAHVVTAGEWIVVEAEGTGQLSDGTEYRNRTAFFYEVHDGLVRTVREYFDTGHVASLFEGLT